MNGAWHWTERWSESKNSERGLEARKEVTQAARRQTEERSEKMTVDLETLGTDLSSLQKTVEQLTSTLEEREEEYRKMEGRLSENREAIGSTCESARQSCRKSGPR